MQISLHTIWDAGQVLENFVLPGVIATGRLLGTGSYGSVEEVSSFRYLDYIPIIAMFSDTGC